MQSVDPRELRDVLGRFTTGVAVATTVGDAGAPVGLTINSFNSVSLSPALILWSLSLSAPSLKAFRDHPAFAINILSIEQADLCHRFARPARDKFAGVRWFRGCQGVPLLADALGSLECRVWRRHEGGDHEIIIGEVTGLRATDKAPLVYHRGRLTNVTLPHDDTAAIASVEGSR